MIELFIGSNDISKYAMSSLLLFTYCIFYFGVFNSFQFTITCIKEYGIMDLLHFLWFQFKCIEAKIPFDLVSCIFKFHFCTPVNVIQSFVLKYYLLIPWKKFTLWLF